MAAQFNNADETSFYQELVFHQIRTQPLAPVKVNQQKHIGRSGASLLVASLKYTG